MKIRKNEYGEVLDYLTQKRGEGYEFVAYPCNVPVDKYEIEYFGSYDEAHIYCCQVRDTYDLIAIRSVYRAMSEGLSNPDLMIEKYGLIDVGAMVKDYYRRLEQRQECNGKNEAEKSSEKLPVKIKSSESWQKNFIKSYRELSSKGLIPQRKKKGKGL